VFWVVARRLFLLGCCYVVARGFLRYSGWLPEGYFFLRCCYVFARGLLRCSGWLQ